MRSLGCTNIRFIQTNVFRWSTIHYHRDANKALWFGPNTIHSIWRTGTIHISRNYTVGVFAEFANAWKIAFIKPLIKKVGLELKSASYCPVSNLTIIPKLVECCMLEQCNQHCNIYRLILSYQLAYRKCHSCETSLLKLCDTILWIMECQKVTSLVVIDLSAVFDTMDHDILLEVFLARYLPQTQVL